MKPPSTSTEGPSAGFSFTIPTIELGDSAITSATGLSTAAKIVSKVRRLMSEKLLENTNGE